MCRGVCVDVRVGVGVGVGVINIEISITVVCTVCTVSQVGGFVFMRSMIMHQTHTTCTHAHMHTCTTHAHRALMHTARAHRSTDAPAVAVAGAEGAPRGNPVKEEEKLQVRELSLT